MTDSSNLRRRRWLSITATAAALAGLTIPSVALAKTPPPKPSSTPSSTTSSSSFSSLFAPPPADTRAGSLTGVAAITGARTAIAAGYGGQGIDVAVLDTGVSPVPGLDGPNKVVNGVDLSFDSQQPGAEFLDGYGHGTHLASIVAENDAESSDPAVAADGYQGIAPFARIVNVRAGDSLGRVDVTQVIAGLDWIVAHRNSGDLNIRVVLLAYGTDSTQSYKTDPLAHAVENAWQHGIVVVTSAGNAGFDGKATATGLTMPAADPMVIAVGGDDPNGTLSTADDTVAGFSSGGLNKRNPDFLAPAVSIEGLNVPGSTVDHLYGATAVTGRFIRGSGTSQAAAVVAGLAADLLSYRPGLTPDQVKALLGSKSHKLAKVDPVVQGFGEVNLVTAGLPPTPPTRKPDALSPGGGSIDASRGSATLVHEGVALTGEMDWLGQPLSGTAIAAAEDSDTAWVGTSWLGRDLLDGPWALPSWDGTAWTSRSWTDEGWDSRSWTDEGWDSRSWTDAAWHSRSWTSRSWTDNSWQ
jgi:serine protease AprX